jgi:hypothetical protein
MGPMSSEAGWAWRWGRVDAPLAGCPCDGEAGSSTEGAAAGG